MTNMSTGDINQQGFKLPTVIDPPDSLCFTIPVPNDPGHIAAFFGAMLELTQWISWQRDAGKHGKDAAAVWREIYWNLQAQSCLVPIASHGAEQEDFMPLRVDCDCNVFVTCCDGTEKQILTADQVRALLTGPAVNPAPQPAPGGGCQTYNGQIIGSQRQLIPTVVSTGDVITLVSIAGATSPDTTDWFCPDGSTYFAACVSGTGGMNVGACLPSTTIYSVILIIDGVYYPFTGNTFTVPAGIANKAPALLVNALTTDDLDGTLTFAAQVCNNSAVRFTHHFNFRLSTYGFVIDTRGGNSNCAWTPGSGYNVSVANAIPPAGDGEISIHLDNALALNNAVMRIVGSCTDGSVDGQDLITYVPPYTGAGAEFYGQNVSGPIDFQHAFLAAVHGLWGIINAGTVLGQVGTLTDFYITADGPDPF